MTYSLPVLSGGIYWLIRDLHPIHNDCVSSEVCIPFHSAVVRVPCIVAAVPWKFRGERRKEVVQSPGEDDVVVAVEEEHNDDACKPDA